ncbi:MAG: DegV family EDD domain-containing protein [Anaerolineales bacterium]|nr:DegV family EDD domain-containing protein [Anaerolineales bacterium]
MSIKIVTDSTCDLPEEVIAKHDITIIPMYINIGSEGFLDGVEITREDFYNGLPNYDPLPTTAVPSVESFRQTYERLADEGASEILSIHVSASLSAVAEVASTAAKEFTRIPVTVYDAGQISLGTGLSVLAAAKAATHNLTVQEILPILEDQSSRTYVIAYIDTLEFLRRSGRMNRFLANFGTILQIKPILKMHAGEPDAERIRTKDKAIKRMIQFVEDHLPLEHLSIVHTHDPEGAEKLREVSEHLFPEDSTSYSVDVTPVLGTHLGPCTVGFTFIEKE